MWIIKVLNGPLAGKAIPLDEGVQTLGRASSCEVLIPYTGVSKSHLKMDVQKDHIIITDLNSKNGTFVNGLKIREHKLKSNDQISIKSILLEVVQLSPAHVQESPSTFGNTALNLDPQNLENFELEKNRPLEEAATPASEEDLATQAKNYMDLVLLPGVYQLNKWFDFKWVLALFVFAFIVLTTLLSTLSLNGLIESNLKTEGQNHALTIAKTLAIYNKDSLMKGLDSALSVEIAQREKRVKNAYIISNATKTILSPLDSAGKYPPSSFISTAVRNEKTTVQQIDNKTIGAVVPVAFFDPRTGGNSVKAYSAVIYNMESSLSNSSNTMSLFVQTLCIALFLGALLYFLLYKLIEYPYLELQNELNKALRKDQNMVQVNLQFPLFQRLVSNVNSLLNRTNQSSEVISHDLPYDRTSEVQNITNLIGFPAFSIDAQSETFSCINPAFEETLGLSADNLMSQKIENLDEEDLKLELQKIFNKLKESVSDSLHEELKFNDMVFDVTVQSIQGNNNVSHYIAVLMPKEGEEGSYGSE